MTSKDSRADVVSLEEARNRAMKVCWSSKRRSASLTWVSLRCNCSPSFDMSPPCPPLRSINDEATGRFPISSVNGELGEHVHCY